MHFILQVDYGWENITGVDYSAEAIKLCEVNFQKSVLAQKFLRAKVGFARIYRMGINEPIHSNILTQCFLL